MIPFIPLQWQFLAKFLTFLALMGLGSIAGWWVTSNHYQTEINALKLANSNAVNAELLRQQNLLKDRAEKIRLAEEQHATDQITINRLGNQLARVRIKLPAISCSPVPGTTQTGENPDGGSGLLYQRVDEAFAELQAGVGQLIQRCDQLNVDAIAANAR